VNLRAFGWVTALRMGVTLLVSAFMLLVLAWLTPAFMQEGNPIPVIGAAVQLELMRAELVPLTPDSRKLMVKAGAGQGVTPWLAKRGWVFRDQLGAAVFYERGSERLMGTSRQLTRRYLVYEFGSVP
jgi:hypothetical protein